MTRFLPYFCYLVVSSLLLQVVKAYSSQQPQKMSRRDALATAFGGVLMATPLPALAAADCFKECMKSCKAIAPKDPDYCLSNCKGYCESPDRADGLSGSVSSSNGEVGILGGTFGQGTVPKGEDKPPSINLPGLDFTNDKGKKLIGY